MALNHHDALIYTMVLVSASDRNMTDQEMQTIGEVVRFLPVFQDFDLDTLPKVAQACAERINKDQGVDEVLKDIVAALPDRLHETAYALALEVAAADGRASQEELKVLEYLRHALDISRLISAAIERGVRARYRRLKG